MNLTRISFTLPNENVRYTDMFGLLKSTPVSELAINAVPRTLSICSEHYDWFEKFISFIQCMDVRFNIALKVGVPWCEMMCCDNTPVDIKRLMNYRRHNDKCPVINRVILDVNSACGVFDTSKIQKMIASNPGVEFVFPYNLRNYDKISALRQSNVPYSLLYRTEDINKLNYLCCCNSVGYSGDFTPSQISKRLSEISKHASPYGSVWFDIGVIDSVSDIKSNIQNIYNCTINHR